MKKYKLMKNLEKIIDIFFKISIVIIAIYIVTEKRVGRYQYIGNDEILFNSYIQNVLDTKTGDIYTISGKADSTYRIKILKDNIINH